MEEFCLNISISWTDESTVTPDACLPVTNQVLSDLLLDSFRKARNEM